MNHFIISSLLLLSTAAYADVCQEKGWEKEAKNFLRNESPKGSSIELIKEGKGFSFSVRHKTASGQYSRTGTLEVRSNSDGGCKVVVIQSQVQSQGDYDSTPQTSDKAEAKVDLDRLNGEWVSDCTQTQNGEHQGFVKERYTFSKSKKITFKKSWFRSSECKGGAFLIENDQGTFEVGKENTNNGFNPTNTHEVKFDMKQKEGLGLIWVNEDYSQMRLSRGIGRSQNTMLSLIHYRRI